MTASSNGKAKSSTGTGSGTTFVADTVKTTGNQMLTVLKQTSTIAMDTASTIIETLGKITPTLPTMPTVPFLPTKSSLTQLVNVGFDTSENLLSMQRGLATQVIERFVPASGAR